MVANRHKGYLCMVLHAHLPYVRHPEHTHFLEEMWLFEAMTECYVPLLDIFSRLVEDGIDFRITLSLSPSLTEMLTDKLLMQRYADFLDRIIELTKTEIRRNKGNSLLEPVTKMYRRRLKRMNYLFTEVYGRNLISFLRMLQKTGHLEIIPTTATHAYLPHLAIYPEAVKAQIRIGMQQHRDKFGCHPNGIWLPECGFASGFDQYIREEGCMFFFLDSHGIIRGAPPPPYGAHLPARCDSGVFAFGRDAEVARQVWSSVSGYPGDAAYRDFYRDIGFDIDEDHVRAFLEPYGAKTYTGLKYYRVTGRTDRKEPYVFERARLKARQHADDFILKTESRILNLSQRFGIRPVITAPFDAELFGHWWFEGVDWLESVIRGICLGRRSFRMIAPSEYLASGNGTDRVQISHPSASSWGENGYHEVWLNQRNDYICRHLLKATERMIELAGRFPNAEGLLRRALNQSARELLLSQHSDWTFMIKNDSSTGYAQRRLQTHIGRFNRLYESVLTGHIEEKTLSAIEAQDAIFRNLDYRVFRRNGQELPVGG